MGSSLFDLTGKSVVVLGGTSGLGRTIALGLADAGADVAVTGRRQSHVDSAAAEIEAKGRKTLRVAADVKDKKSVTAVRDAAVAAFGKVDVLVYAAGVTRKTPSLDVSETEWNDILETNLSGAFRASQIFGQHMLQRKSGRIIFIASIGSFVGMYQVTAYNASKAGVAALTRSLAVEWSRHGVLVNSIAPGVFRTDLNAALLDGTERGREFLMRTPLGRFGKTEELIGAAVFLASDASSYVTGQLLAVDGGFLASGVNT